MTAPSSLLIIDPGMTFSFGHHGSYNMGLRDAALSRGWGFRLLAGADLAAADNEGKKKGNCSNGGKEEAGTDPANRAAFANGKEEPHGDTIFQGGRQKKTPLVQDGILDWPFYAESDYAPDAPPEAMLPPARALAAQLHETADSLLRPGALTLCHTLHPSALLGLLLWRAALPPLLRPRLAANLMLGLDASEATVRRLAFCAAHTAPDDEGLKLFAGTRSAAALLSTVFRRECPMLPSPLPPGMLNHMQAQAPEPPVFALLGSFRGGKNLHLLPAAVMRYLKRGGQGRFVIRMPPIDPDMHAICLALHELGSSLPARFDMRFEHTDTAAYYAAMSGSSALILPYAPENYHFFRPSGPAIEAAALGVPVLAFEGGFIEDELAPLDNGSLFIEGKDAASLAEGLLLFEREARQRKAQAVAAAGAYAARHNAGAVLELICA